MKNLFLSTEALLIILPPCVDKTTGEYITGGSDVLTLTIRKPDGTLLSGGPHLATYLSNIDMWSFTIATGSYAAGSWLVRAVSNDADALPQWVQYQWGGYVNDIAAAAADASISRKIATGRWKIDAVAKQLVLYDGSGPTVLYTFDLKDENGLATATRIFERTPA